MNSKIEIASRAQQKRKQKEEASKKTLIEIKKYKNFSFLILLMKKFKGYKIADKQTSIWS